MPANSPWSCAFCKQAISYDRLFTFIKAGAVHFECFKKDAQGRNQNQSLVDLLEAELKLLVAYKMAAKSADGELKPILESQGKDSEKHAAVLTKRLASA